MTNSRNFCKVFTRGVMFFVAINLLLLISGFDAAMPTWYNAQNNIWVGLLIVLFGLGVCSKLPKSKSV